MTGRFDDLADAVAPPVAGDDEAEVASTWALIDLTEALAGVDIPPPAYLRRSDDAPLLYPGRVHWFQGEAESLKSWAAQWAAVEVLAAGGNVLYVDYEDDDRGIVARMRSLRVAVDVLGDPERFRYLRPDEPLYDSRGNAQRHVAELKHHLQHIWALAVIDGVTEAMTIENLDILDNTDIAMFQRRLPKRIAAAGAAVICLDHVAKNRDGRSRYAIGGQHKLAGVTGASYGFAVTKRLRRALSDPTTGRVNITVEKDRPGWVRARAEGDADMIAVLEVTAYPDGDVRIDLLVPSDAATAPEWAVLGGILGYLANYDGASKNAIETSVPGRADALRTALTWLVQHDLVSVTKVGSAHRHSLTDAGRKRLDEGDT